MLPQTQDSMLRNAKDLVLWLAHNDIVHYDDK